MKQQNGDKLVLNWLIAGAKGKKRYVCLLGLACAIMGATGSIYAVLLRGLVNSAVAGRWDDFTFHGFLLGCLVAVQFALQCGARYLEEYTRCSLENTFKKRLFAKLMTKDYASVTATHSGEWLHRLTSDTTIVANNVTSILPGIAGTVSRLAVAIALLIVYAPGFTLGFSIGGALLMVVIWSLRRIIKRLHQQVQIADGNLRVYLSERLGSMMILRAFEQEQAAVEQGEALMDAHMTARMKKNRVSNIFHNGFSLAVKCVYVVGAIYCGYGILNGNMSYGDFTAVQQLVTQAQGPIANISAYFPQYSALLASAERLMEAENYEDVPTESAVADMPAFYRNEFRGLGLKNAGFTYLPVGELEVNEESRRKVLRNLNMEIGKGEYVAFCGPSGCGKSTVLKLLMCMYDLDEGQRYVLGAEGKMPLTAGWRGLFSYVPQGNQLMSGTIREVVTFANPADMAREDDIRRALTISCADQFIDELPEGLDTLLGERGAGLSEGQMQRIAIARAVFSDRPVLLLDEATSALDEETEAKLLDNLRSMTDKTVIIVTHRPAALDITDKIINFNPAE